MCALFTIYIYIYIIVYYSILLYYTHTHTHTYVCAALPVGLPAAWYRYNAAAITDDINPSPHV